VDNDPRKFIISQSNTSAFMVNKFDKHGQTALYLAAKHGHSEMVQFLVDIKADPLIMSSISTKEIESPLEVACRWHHTKTVEILLNSTNWSSKELKKANNMTKNKEIKVIIASYLKSRGHRRCYCGTSRR
jgi:ankyrin repeat protein